MAYVKFKDKYNLEYRQKKFDSYKDKHFLCTVIEMHYTGQNLISLNKER